MFPGVKASSIEAAIQASAPFAIPFCSTTAMWDPVPDSTYQIELTLWLVSNDLLTYAQFGSSVVFDVAQPQYVITNNLFSQNCPANTLIQYRVRSVSSCGNLSDFSPGIFIFML
jgi:hypothetical protein